MNDRRRILVYIFYILLGAALFALGFAEVLDAFWSGMGGALIGVGVVRIVQAYRYRRDEAYREKMEVALSDERNRFLRNKAWAWAGYLFVLIAAVATLVLKLVGQELLSMAAGFALCILLILYWVSYLIVRRKY